MSINFEHIEGATAASSTGTRSDAAKEAERRAVRERQLQQIEEELADKGRDIRENLAKLETCFKILVPAFDDNIFGGDDEKSDGTSPTGKPPDTTPTLNQTVITSGLASTRYRLTIELSHTVSERTEENEVVHVTLREAYRLLSGKHEDVISDWMKRIVKAAPQRNEQQHDLLKQIIALREAVALAKEKAEELGANVSEKHVEDEDEEEDDADFEEVPIASGPGRLPRRHRRLRRAVANQVFALKDETGLEDDVTYRPYVPATEDLDVLDVDEGPSLPVFQGVADAGVDLAAPNDEETREDRLKRAPVVAYGEDLDHWDKATMEFNTTGLEFSHRFWGVSVGDNEVSKETLDRMKKRLVYYQPKQKQDLKECRHPIRGGALCPRRQAEVCPFHGRIIPRDDRGQPIPEGVRKGKSVDTTVTTGPSPIGSVEKTTSGGLRVPFCDYDDNEVSGPLIEDVFEEVDVSSSRYSSGESLRKGAPSSSKAQSFASSAGAAADDDRNVQKRPETWEDLEADVTGALGLTKIAADRRKQKKRKTRGTESALVKLSKSKEPKTALERLEKKLTSRESAKRSTEAYQRDAAVRARNRQANTW